MFSVVNISGETINTEYYIIFHNNVRGEGQNNIVRNYTWSGYHSSLPSHPLTFTPKLNIHNDNQLSIIFYGTDDKWIFCNVKINIFSAKNLLCRSNAILQTFYFNILMLSFDILLFMRTFF